MEHTLTIAVLDHLHDLSLHRDTPSGGAQDYSDALRKWGPALEVAAREHLQDQAYWEGRIQELQREVKRAVAYSEELRARLEG